MSFFPPININVGPRPGPSLTHSAFDTPVLREQDFLCIAAGKLDGIRPDRDSPPLENEASAAASSSSSAESRTTEEDMLAEEGETQPGRELQLF